VDNVTDIRAGQPELREDVPQRSLADVANEIKVEVKDFLQTRFEMLRAEMNENLAALKAGIPMLVIGAVLGVMVLLLFTAALVAVIAPAIEHEYRWAIALGIVGLGYLVIGGAAAWMGYREITARGLAPRRTIKVLKDDQVWLQNEARRQA
jgi:uncharacterized membrane protein YqjE